MSYMHIDNLYKNQDILLFKECYAMEKIHGTSAHVAWYGLRVKLFAGGSDYFAFKKLFDEPALEAVFKERFADGQVPVFGEAYGGKLQGMSKTYGKVLKFVAFEVRVGKSWLAVPAADDVCAQLGLDFVYYRLIPTTLEAIDAERDAPSAQAVRCGIVDEPKMREGVVLRPLRLSRTTAAGSSPNTSAPSSPRREPRERWTQRNASPTRARRLLPASGLRPCAWPTYSTPSRRPGSRRRGPSSRRWWPTCCERPGTNFPRTGTR